MAIDLSTLESQLGTISSALLSAVVPYLPALATQGENVFNEFILHVKNKDWYNVDKLMYQYMSPQERYALDQQIITGVRDATTQKLANIKLTEDVAFSFALKLAMALIVI